MFLFILFTLVIISNAVRTNIVILIQEANWNATNSITETRISDIIVTNDKKKNYFI